MTQNLGERPREYPDRKPLNEQPRWQQDFPTDIPEDDHVARREFVKFLVLTSGAFVAGQCWIGLSSFRKQEGHPRQRVASVEELETKHVVEFRYPDDHEPCLALRLAPGRYVAFGQKCTHLACAVVPNLERGELHCPCHNGYFEAEEGRPIAGPPRRPLPRIALEVLDGVVYATGVELRTV